MSNEVGRPSLLDENMRRKIDEAAQLGCSIEEIAMWCGVWRSTVYRWMIEEPELKDRIQELQERPIMKARQTIVKALDNPSDAQWYLERKRKKEFSPKVETEHTGGIEHIIKIDDGTNNNLVETPQGTTTDNQE